MYQQVILDEKAKFSGTKQAALVRMDIALVSKELQEELEKVSKDARWKTGRCLKWRVEVSTKEAEMLKLVIGD